MSNVSRTPQRGLKNDQGPRINRRQIGAGLVATLGLAVTGFGQNNRGADAGGPPVTDTASAPTTEFADPEVETLATIPIGIHVVGGIITDDAVWAVSEDEMMFRIDPATNQVVDEVPVPGIGYRFDIGHGAAWTTDFEASVVRRVDLDSGALIAEITTGVNPEGIDVTDDAVWVADHRGGTVTRIDPATNLVVATITVGPPGPAGPQPIAVDGDRVWTGVPNLNQVVGIDAATNEVVANVDVPAACGEMEVLDGAVWVTSCFEDDIVNIVDAESGTLRGAIETGGFAGTPLPIDNLVWIPTVQLDEGHPGRILGINPWTLDIVDTISLDVAAYTAGVGFESVWLFSYDAGVVIRLPLDPFQTHAARRH